MIYLGLGIVGYVLLLSFDLCSFCKKSIIIYFFSIVVVGLITISSILLLAINSNLTFTFSFRIISLGLAIFSLFLLIYYVFIEVRRNGYRYKIETDEIKEKIKEEHAQSIYTLAAKIYAKDHYTYGHSNNVALISAALAKEANFGEKDIDIVKSAGLLHDIGKVGIPKSVLSKTGSLDNDEMEIMKSHVVQSVDIIKDIPNLLETVPIIMSHHERYDGGGYPRGIKGTNIPILGRVICIADSFDAMTTDRPYRRRLTLEQAIYELKKNASKQFDPVLVDTFISMIKTGKLDTLSLENRPSL